MTKDINPTEVFTRYMECSKRIRRCVKPCEKCKYNWNEDEVVKAMKIIINQGEN